MKRKTLSDLKTVLLPRLDWRQLFTVGAPEELDAGDETEMQEYFAQFLPPGNCVMCGAQQGGSSVVDAFLKNRFTWGLANGEGFCGECHYPARAYHRNVGPIEFVNIVLQYHPDELTNGKAQPVHEVESVIP